ncbi:hypothetical protein H6F51_04325 [Cyanobacteria bacterium FACHB-DQ100]|nr:hypothetical protein [Cyanobacteria bacterium FACHB-DQ100]
MEVTHDDNAQTREIVGTQLGDRSAVSAQALWDSMPPVYRQCAVIYTDHWSAYGAVLPRKRHRSVGKDGGLTVITGVPVGQKVLVVLEKVRQPHFSHLEFCVSLHFVHHYKATRRRKLAFV